MFGMDKLSLDPCCNTGLGLPEGVQWYVEWRSLFIAKAHINKEKNRKNCDFSSFRFKF